MGTTADTVDPTKINALKLPSGAVKEFIPYLSAHPKAPLGELLEPYKAYENELRKIYAQQPSHELVKDPWVNLVPIFTGHEHELKIRARSLDTESDEVKSQYIMSLAPEQRKPPGAPAIVSSFKEFQDNFNIFSESSLADLDWNNVVAAGSSVTTALLPVPEAWAGTKRSMREYYHEHLAPASDVDLFLYGLNEAQAIEKITQIEECVKDSILHEVTTIRTKNAITIASQYPTRHVQIVLRLYDSISQIITGFDVDCACAAYDGNQVYAAPRAIAAFMTQCNTIDLTRRSPSYENRLSKYSHRGFEVHWPLLDRSRVDPTIFERSFGRTQGLARLLILEKLPKTTDRDNYMDQRRAERGRPAINRWRRSTRMNGNIKEQEEDDVAEWVEQEEVASYHTMTVPYGPKYHAARINRLLYAKDLLLNAEWNQSEDREVYLHRHPCFFGTSGEIIEDCCGSCPVPKTDEEIEVAEEESKLYVSGELKFITDDPGRQEIGSFNPITDDEWTTMAYVGDTARLSQAIVDGDLEHVQDWCEQEGVDVNRRDYTGRTPLHLATMTSTLEIVQCLVGNGARLIARLVDGRTALHLAAARGNAKMVAALMDKSLENEEEEDEKNEARKKAMRAQRAGKESDNKDKEKRDGEASDTSSEASEITLDSEDDLDSMTVGSFVKVNKENGEEDEAHEDSQDGPDVYDVDVLAWDHGLSPLHLAILNGHLDVIDLLVSEYAADVLLPVKILEQNRTPRGAIMTLVLATYLPTEKAKQVVKLLLNLGATSAQADMNHITALHYIVAGGDSEILDTLLSNDRPAALSVINNFGYQNYGNLGASPLQTAIDKEKGDMVSTLLRAGAKPLIEFQNWIKPRMETHPYLKSSGPEENMAQYQISVTQPVILAAENLMGKTIEELIKHGADPDSMDANAYSRVRNQWTNVPGHALLDIVQRKLKALRNYMDPDQPVTTKPEELQDQKTYTRDIPTGTYQYWCAVEDFKAEKQKNKAAWKSYENTLQRRAEKGAEEKMAAIAEVLRELEKTEKSLIEAGAKSLYELHPELTKPEKPQGIIKPQNPARYSTTLIFTIPDLTDPKKGRYLKLFEAAWVGDIDTVKAMTLATSPGVEKDSADTPLKIAVQDSKGFSPFSISVLRGHYDLAKAIVEICMAQYHEDDNKSHRQRWSVRRSRSQDDSSDTESEDEDENVLPIFSELISDTFTIDNLGEVSKVVKSEVLPSIMIGQHCDAKRFLSPDKTLDNWGQRQDLLQYAVATDDMKLLKFLINLGREQQARLVDSSDDPSIYTVAPAVLTDALRCGRTELLAEMIKTTGVGMPLNELVVEHGAEIKSKPKYYQGLTVKGKKRADWAQAPDERHVAAENKIPPLLQAARLGSVESVEWFMSDAPLRRYKEFAERNKNDARIKALGEAGKGLDNAIGSWLDTKNELVLHCAILYNPSALDADKSAKYLALIKHIVSVAPETLEQKTIEGWTPLQHAVLLDREDVVAYLLSVGADQRQRDKSGRNMAHSMVIGKSAWGSKTDAGKLQRMIELFDREAFKDLLLERTMTKAGAHTPLGLWVARNHNHNKGDFVEALTKYSTGEDLEMINGKGELPLHVAVTRGLTTVTAFLVSLNPALLHRENATGRTPLEMAREIYLTTCVRRPPPVFSYYLGFPQHEKILQRAAAEFVPGALDASKGDLKSTWEVCNAADTQMYEKDGDQRPPRRLVSLFEANEVAKQVAPTSRYGGSQTVVNGFAIDLEIQSDPVSKWMIEM